MRFAKNSSLYGFMYDKPGKITLADDYLVLNLGATK